MNRKEVINYLSKLSATQVREIANNAITKSWTYKPQYQLDKVELVLTGYNPEHRLPALRCLRRFTSLSLTEVQSLLDNFPYTLVDNLQCKVESDVSELRNALTLAGLTYEERPIYKSLPGPSEPDLLNFSWRATARG